MRMIRLELMSRKTIPLNNPGLSLACSHDIRDQLDASVRRLRLTNLVKPVALARLGILDYIVASTTRGKTQKNTVAAGSWGLFVHIYL